jgi:hypothetical protein
MQELLHDYLFRYPYNHQATGGCCRVRVYQTGKNSHIVLLSELSSHAAGSIAAAADIIATNLVTRYAFDPKKTRWIEHLPPEDDQPGEFGELVFTWKAGKAAPDPKFRQMEEAEAETLTGVPIEQINRPLGETEQA